MQTDRNYRPKSKKSDMFSHARFLVLATSYSRTHSTRSGQAYRRTTIGAAAFSLPCRKYCGRGRFRLMLTPRERSHQARESESGEDASPGSFFPFFRPAVHKRNDREKKKGPYATTGSIQNC